jgi:hypothetical protein
MAKEFEEMRRAKNSSNVFGGGDTTKVVLIYKNRCGVQAGGSGAGCQGCRAAAACWPVAAGLNCLAGSLGAGAAWHEAAAPARAPQRCGAR